MDATNMNARTIPLRTALLMAVGAGLVGALVALLATGGPAGDESAAAGSPDSADELTTLEHTAAAGTLADDLAVTRENSARGEEQRIVAGSRVDEAFRAADDERAQISRSVLDLSRNDESLQLRIDALANQLADLETALSGQAVSDSPIGLENLPQGDFDLDGNTVTAADDAADLSSDGGERTQREEREILIAAGIDPAQADDIRVRRNRFELDRLELVDQATREGWLDSERFDQQLDTLRAERPDLREELGDGRYDRFLFEQGSPNRVEIADILEGSAASLAGMQRGDVVLLYANDRVFGTRDLQRATREGSRGEPVAVTVQRGAEVLSISVPRGPLGVTLQGRRSPPG